MTTDVLIILFFGLLWLGAVYALTTWAIHDAEARGKPGWAVACLVFLLFPIGPVIWGLIRPPKRPTGSRRGEFDLQDYRVQ